MGWRKLVGNRYKQTEMTEYVRGLQSGVDENRLTRQKEGGDGIFGFHLTY